MVNEHQAGPLSERRVASLGPHILPHMRSARTVTLLEVVVCEGAGTPGNVVREVTYYFTADGGCVGLSDPQAALELPDRSRGTT